MYSFVSNYCYYRFFSFANLPVYEFELGQGVLFKPSEVIRDDWMSNKRERSDSNQKPEVLFI